MDLIARAMATAIQGVSGERYKIVACVLQNNGSGVWQQIPSANHKSINVASVTNNTETITVNFGFTAKNILSFIAAPDETFVSKGYNFGSSVGVSSAIIQGYRTASIGGYISYNGSAWDFTYATGVSSAVWSTDRLTITHDKCSGSIIDASCREGVYICQTGQAAPTVSEVLFFDYAGTKITTPNTNMKCYFSRPGVPLNMDPTVNVPGANIWCLGIFEV